MKWLLIGAATLVALLAVVYGVGALLPRDHVASVRVHLPETPDQVYALIADVRAAPAWRHDVESVEILSSVGETLQWRETGSFGVLTFARDEDVPGRRIVGRIADTSQGFGGRWIYEIQPSGSGATLTITEEGQVFNPMFRFMSRFVFGHYATMESYVRSLGRHFGHDVSVERVTS
jgi:hypothetical protein